MSETKKKPEAAHSTSNYAEHSVLHAESGIEPALCNKHRLIEPSVSGITSLESRRNSEILVTELCTARASHRCLHLLIHLYKALVLNVDKSSIVGFNLRPDIESTEAVGAYKKPISASADELPAQPRPLKRAANDIEYHPSACWPGTDRQWWTEHRVVRHLVD